MAILYEDDDVMRMILDDDDDPRMDPNLVDLDDDENDAYNDVNGDNGDDLPVWWELWQAEGDGHRCDEDAVEHGEHC